MKLIYRPRAEKGGDLSFEPMTPHSGKKQQQFDLSSGKRKRLFLSGKAAVVHSDARPAKVAKRRDGDEDQQHSFSDMLREVESLGMIQSFRLDCLMGMEYALLPFEVFCNFSQKFLKFCLHPSNLK